MAVLKAPSPTYQWWEDFWGHSGVEIESAVAAKGLSHIAHTRNLPKHNISMLAGSFKRMQQTPCLQHWPEPQQQQHKKHLVADMEASAEHWFVSDSSNSSSSNSSRSWHTHPLAELHMAEALQIVTNLQDVAKQHAQCRATAHLDTEGYQVMSAPRAAALLWASARLQRMPPKVLLWQLLLLILIDVHSLNPRYLTAVLQAIGGLQQRFGKRQVECFRVIKPIVLAVQWRLLVGLAGTTPREQQQVMKSLRFAASQNGQLMSIMLLHKISSAKHSPSSFLKDCSILMV